MQTTITTRNLIAVLGMIAALLTAVTLPAQASDSTREGEFLQMLNAERTSRGKGALSLNTQLRSVARSWSDVMDRDTHLKHNPNLASQVTEDWTRLGENVGVGYSVGSLHQAFMDSPGHRANILGDYNQVGIGVTMDGARIWVTVVFMKGPHSSNTLSSYSADTDWYFRDVAKGATHATNIEAIREAGITNGCGSRTYCPDRYVTRAEMASFLARAAGLPKTSESFSDVASSDTHAGAIGAIAKAGITKGCGDGRYCPDRYVTRAEMASFLARAAGLPKTSESFSDVASSDTHAGAIGAIAKAGITNGCGDGQYCPDRYVTRAEMASFLARAFLGSTS